MSLPHVVIFGAGGHARVIIEALQMNGAAEVVAAVDADPAMHGKKILGVDIAGGDEVLANLRAAGVTHFVVAVGSVGRTHARARLFALGVSAQLIPLTVHHPSAYCSPSATVGAGAQLLAGCVVNTQAGVGANAIINCGAVVEHDCVIGLHSHVASRACLAGGVLIGDEVHVGAGAVVKQGVRIGNGAVIGAGAVVLRDVAQEDVVAGVPAESIREKMSVRVIARLDIKGPNLVKGVHMEGLRVLGKPERFARLYYEQGADELIYMDAVASLYGRNSLLQIVEKTSREIFIPLCVGGGLRSVDDIRAVLRAGADKVSLNTAAIRRPELIREASRAFGSSTVVISLEVIRLGDGRYECLTDYGREHSGVDPFEWAVRAADLGAGELVVTSVNKEGTGEGYDLELTRRIAQSVPIPVIASGGAGQIQHVVDAVKTGRADAVCMASILHYNVVRHTDYSRAEFAAEGNIEFLKRGAASFSKIQDVTLRDIKKELRQAGVDCREWNDSQS